MASTKLVVAAIDFGTTFSGYAFSFTHEYHSDPLKIQSNHWSGGGHMSHKAPTAVLFTPKEEFHSFGYEAEDKYIGLVEEDVHKEWFFFRRFKMLLHNNKMLSKQTKLHDEEKKEMLALTVFSAAIRYLRDHLTDTLRKRCPEIRDDDVHWVLTVPAIWNDSAKQFMRQAALQADIKNENVMLSLEPEAASVLCRQLPIERIQGEMVSDLGAFKPGQRYIVMDLGGGTVDITVHAVLRDGNLSEVTKASGGAWGGTQVDNAFLEFLQEIAGTNVLEEFQEDEKEDYLAMMREFEVKKRNVSLNSEGSLTMRIPISVSDIFKSKNGKSISEHLSSTQYANEVRFKRDKAQFDYVVIQGFFQKSIEKTVKHVRSIFQENDIKNVATVLMVGGFAESPIVQESMRAAFPDKKIIVPNESGMVVLKGAVLFGHSPDVLQSRKSKYSYGLDINKGPFQEGYDRDDYKFYDTRSKIYRCRHVFDVFVRAGESIQKDAVLKRSYTSSIEDITDGVGIYVSTSEFPRYVTDSESFRLGSIFLSGVGHQVNVEMKFGGTEFSVQINDLDTGEKLIDSFDFLQH